MISPKLLHEPVDLRKYAANELENVVAEQYNNTEFSEASCAELCRIPRHKIGKMVKILKERSSHSKEIKSGTTILLNKCIDGIEKPGIVVHKLLPMEIPYNIIDDPFLGRDWYLLNVYGKDGLFLRESFEVFQ